MQCSENQRSAQFVALIDRSRSLPEPGDGVTIAKLLAVRKYMIQHNRLQQS
jgi:hypothetical protein